MAKEIGTESHVYDKQGNLEGLWTIDGRAAREHFGDKKFWLGVDEVIRLYTRINPSEMHYAKVENDIIKSENHNKYGSNKEHSFRQALNIPHGLYLALLDYEPKLFKDKVKRTTFMKRYSNLCSCDVV